MKESVAIAKEADTKKDFSPTRSDNSINHVRPEPERQLGSLRSVIEYISRDGGTPSVDSIATELSNMHTAQRASVLLALQRTHGNRYVQRVVSGIQAKLKVGQQGDVYEQEADRVAERVMRMSEPEIQRQVEEEQEEEILQRKPLVSGTPSVDSIATELSGMPTGGRAPALLALQQTHGNRYVQRAVAGIQAKLVVGQPGDIYEQEADRVADEVMRMPEPHVQRQAEEEEEEEEIQAKPLAEQITPLVQRQVEPEEEEEEPVQSKSLNNKASLMTANTQSKIQSLRGGGHPLPASTRAFFESRFGMDFSNVHVHTNSHAAELARSLNAKAFTKGKDVVFGAGQYVPWTSEGKRLIAHELTHVIHQLKGMEYLQRTITVNNRGCSPLPLDLSHNSTQIGAMFGTSIAYGLTNCAIRTPGHTNILGQMTNADQGEIWVENATVDPILEVQIYLTSNFGSGTCKYNWVLAHEERHKTRGCSIYGSKIPLLQSDLNALPGPTTRQAVSGNQAAVELERQALENRFRTILSCFRIEICRDIGRSNRQLDLLDYPIAFNSCPPPLPSIPVVPPIARYLSTCSTPPSGCPRTII